MWLGYITFNKICCFLITANTEQIDKATDIVKKLQFAFSSENFENPALQQYYVNVEAMALDYDEPDKVSDYTSKSLDYMSKSFRGFAKNFFLQKSEIIMEVGGGSRSHSEFLCVENRPKIALNQYWYFGVVYHVYSVCIYIAKSCWLLWFECFVHVSEGFQKIKLDGGGWVGGWGELYPIFFGFFEFF